MHWKTHGDLQSSTPAQQMTVPNSSSMTIAKPPNFPPSTNTVSVNPAPHLTSQQERTHKTTPIHHSVPQTQPEYPLGRTDRDRAARTLIRDRAARTRMHGGAGKLVRVLCRSIQRRPQCSIGFCSPSSREQQRHALGHSQQQCLELTH